MAPENDIIDPSLKDQADNKAKRLSNATIITQRVAAAEKWKAEHQKNTLLFPASYDYF